MNSIPAFKCIVFSWCIFFHPFMFYLSLPLYLQWIPCRQKINGACFFTQSDKLWIQIIDINEMKSPSCYLLFVPHFSLLTCVSFFGLTQFLKFHTTSSINYLANMALWSVWILFCSLVFSIFHLENISLFTTFLN